MNLHYSLNRTGDRPMVLAIGFFDGVHRGHRDIARHARMLRKPGWRTAVLTFSNHPLSFLRPGSQPKLITTPEERIDLLAAAGYDECFFVPFDEAIAHLEPNDFLHETLVKALHVRGVVVGKTFRFGRARTGDTEMMARFFHGESVAFAAVENTPDESGVRISSTRIRERISLGDIAAADDLLGHAYELRGKVMFGEGRGHGLGFPTANIDVPNKLLPKDGVYSAVARIEGTDRAALVSIGTNPTFDGKSRTIEAWLRDFEETIYGRELSLRDLRFVREQRKFADAAELLAQMQDDAQAVPYPAYG